MRASQSVIQLRSYALAFAVVLSPVFLQATSCERGDTHLSSLQFEVNGYDQIPCFDLNNRSYSVTTGSSTATLTVQTRALSSTATYQWIVEGETVESGVIGDGGGQVTLDVPNPAGTLRVGVRAAEGNVGAYSVYVNSPSGAVGDAELLATWNSNTQSFSDLAVGANGDAVAVWEQFDFDTSVLNVYASRLTSGVWGAAELLETDDAGHARNPSVAVAPNGDAVVLWSQHPGNIYANRLLSGVWTGGVLVETISTGAAVYPRVAVYPNGDAVAVWQQYEGSNRNIYANRLTSGVWGVPDLLETTDYVLGGYPSAGRAEAPQIAVAANGDAVAVWEQRDDSATGRDIYANRLTSGVWGGAELVDLGAGIARDPQVAVAANGDAVVVWDQDIRIYARRLTSGVWEETMDSLNTPVSGVGHPQVAVDPNGNAVVVWQQFDFGLQNVYANQFASGVWGGQALLETSDGGDAGGAFVAVDPNGDAVAVWTQLVCLGNSRNAYSNRLTSGAWGEAELIETIDGGDVGPTGVGVDANGNAVTTLLLREASSQKSLYGTQLTSSP